MSFVAGFQSECENCEEPIEAGQLAVAIDFDNRKYAHASCPEPKDEPKQTACPKCFTVHAPNQKECW